MQLPIVAHAPLVTAHADVFRDLFENRRQFQHFQNYLTGLIVLDNKSLTNITRCVLESADKTNLSRFFSEAPWLQARVNDRRVAYLLQQTTGARSAQADAALILDDTCASMWAVCSTTWTAITTMATTRIRLPTIR
jgi:SRSO17 transposase